LEDGLIRRVGGSDLIHVNVRVIAAMNEHPSIALKNQKLRSDLFYRLNVFTFSLLPLRERKEDILLLSDYFISRYNEKVIKKIEGIEPRLENFFMKYPWPGNVRELKHTIEYMMNVCERERLGFEDLPPMLKHSTTFEDQKSNDETRSLSLKINIETLEKELIAAALNRTNGNIKKAALLLEIPRQTLQYKLKKMLDS
jgi:arginine utilization regulatory protein